VASIDSLAAASSTFAQFPGRLLRSDLAENGAQFVKVDRLG
jgi:hypothetical protein